MSLWATASQWLGSLWTGSPNLQTRANGLRYQAGLGDHCGLSRAHRGRAQHRGQRDVLLPQRRSIAREWSGTAGLHAARQRHSRKCQHQKAA